MKFCVKTLWFVVFQGKKDDLQRGNMVVRALLGHSELLHTFVTAAFGV